MREREKDTSDVKGRKHLPGILLAAWLKRVYYYFTTGGSRKHEKVGRVL